MPEDVPARPIPLAPEAIAGLTDLVSNIEALDGIMQAAATTAPAGSIHGFASRVAKVCDAGFSATLEVLNALSNIRRMQRVRGIDAAQMVNILTVSLGTFASVEWKEQYLEDWGQVSPRIVSAIESIGQDHPLHVSEKAQTLAYSHQNILSSQRIITDVRPVFDKDASDIKETIILHTLLLEYTDGISGPRRVAFTLDSADIRELRESCDRAEQKAVTTLGKLEDFNPIELPEDPEERGES